MIYRDINVDAVATLQALNAGDMTTAAEIIDDYVEGDADRCRAYIRRVLLNGLLAGDSLDEQARRLDTLGLVVCL